MGEGLVFGLYELPGPLVFGHPFILLWTTKMVVEEVRIFLVDKCIALALMVWRDDISQWSDMASWV